MLGMGASQGGLGGRLRLGLLAAVAALLVLVPATAASAAEFTLTVTVEGEGFVFCEAENEEEGFFEEECGGSESVTETDFLEGTEVSLLAIEEPEYEFKEFTGDCGGSSCSLVMDEDHEVTVVFAPEGVNPLVLDITVEGEGGVECELESGPEECETEYPEGTELTLIAAPDSGYKFVEFAGDCNPVGLDECEVTMDEDKFVDAFFEAVEGEGEEEEGGKEESGGGSSGGGGTSSGSQPSVTVPLPGPTGSGKATVAGAGLFKGGKAMLRISCKGAEPCKGTVKLIARLKVGRATKSVTVGTAPFDLPGGGSKVLTIRLSGPAKRLLGKGRTLTASASGSGVTASKVKIKPTQR